MLSKFEKKDKGKNGENFLIVSLLTTKIIVLYEKYLVITWDDKQETFSPCQSPSLISEVNSETILWGKLSPHLGREIWSTGPREYIQKLFSHSRITWYYVDRKGWVGSQSNVYAHKLNDAHLTGGAP